MRGWILVTLGALLILPGCASLHTANLSGPAVTDDGTTVWWAEHRALDRGPNDTRVIMCRAGERPICIRVRPVETSAR